MNESLGRHGLHIYRSDSHLTSCVARFAAAALTRGEPVILLPSLAREADLVQELETRGLHVDALLHTGLLMLGDADGLAGACLRVPRLGMDEHWKFIDRTLGTLRARGFMKTAIWSETPDLLLKAGRRDLFRDLEARWAQITAAGPGVSLLCSYRANLLDENIYGGELLAVCAAHTHVESAENGAQLEDAVETAFMQVLSPREIGMAWSLADVHTVLPKALPSAAHRLHWLVENMPATYKKVFSAARLQAAA